MQGASLQKSLCQTKTKKKMVKFYLTSPIAAEGAALGIRFASGIQPWCPGGL
jgi:hypothetical protein